MEAKYNSAVKHVEANPVSSVQTRAFLVTSVVSFFNGVCIDRVSQKLPLSLST